MDQALIDAHLFSIGITSDARNQSVLLLGDDDEDELTKQLAARLGEFGAHVVYWRHITINPTIVCDFAVIRDLATFNLPYLLSNHLKPDGRYLILLPDLGDDVQSVVLTNVEQIGEDVVRITGVRVRRTGEDVR